MKYQRVDYPVGYYGISQVGSTGVKLLPSWDARPSATELIHLYHRIPFWMVLESLYFMPHIHETAAKDGVAQPADADASVLDPTRPAAVASDHNTHWENGKIYMKPLEVFNET